MHFEQNLREPEKIRDMDEVLREKKKKLTVKMKNHIFPSIPDIFETRNDAHVDELMNAINNPVQKKDKILDYIKSKMPSMPKFTAKKIKPY